ncbi:MAG: PAS domain S-box protein [Candidatus Zixiibacteriota bacterium]
MLSKVLIIISLCIQTAAVVYCFAVARSSSNRWVWNLAGVLSILMLGVRVAQSLHISEDVTPNATLILSSVIMPVISAVFLGAAILIRKLEKQLHTQKSALQESESRLEVLLHNAPDYIFTVRLDGTITYFNRAEPSYQTRDLVGTNWFSWLTEDCKLPVRSAIDAAVATQHSIIVDTRLASPDFSANYYECHVSPIFSSDGVESILVIARDITEFHKTDEALRESEARYRRLVESSRDAILVHCDTKIVYANSATAELFGAADASELLGKSPFTFVHPEFASLVRERIRSAVVDRTEVPVVRLRSVRMDGTSRELLSTAHPYVWDGKPAIQVILKDITELIKTQEALAESETLFRGLFTEMHVSCAIHEVITDAAGEPIDFITIETNPAFEKVTGFTRQQILGKRIREAYPMA